ncbi:glutamine synthetase/guanido kinase [Lactarius vividus]|nr:glutamine synthetase/guanido kinase [Lactarius vividus]
MRQPLSSSVLGVHAKHKRSIDQIRSQVGGASLDELSVRYIRFQWLDYTNISRNRIIPIPAFSELLEASRPGVGIATAAFGIVGSSIAPGFSATGDSIRLCGYAPGHANLMGWFEEKLPIQKQVGKDALDMPLCSRGLPRGIGHALGAEFLAGFETEFILLKATQPIEAVNDATWSASCAFSPGSNAAKCLEEIADALQTGEIELLMYHSEAAPGQYVVTGPLPPLEAADAVAFTRETIVNIAAKHGSLNCSIIAGTAAHSHISIHPTTQPPANLPPANPNTNNDTTMTPLERSFLQSLLENLPSSTVFTLPTAASYDRVQDCIWSCGTYACWGEDNKDVAILLTGPPGSHHLEVRTIDGTANPHIALATVLGLGLIGVQKGLELKIGATDRPAVFLSAEELGHLHRTLSAARDAARKDATISDVLGQEFVQTYLSVNETMEKNMDTGNAEQNKIKNILTY